ncbi:MULTISPECIES: ABC transporter ATP-binding protein [Nocardiopsis]|uniref:Oligopeptide/dipeptide ABC transporter, ATPase subunit n=2 Tax=Nocardiopsis TaxID=2013 RepID=D7AXA8_NOCDD|nr:ABC transporter ATP-binding protein [Nocardiopsis dassonvillei]ADH65982.1 oligopeptide/dipeptide ABC transporter, ATPase subunit [Nocardiopsis dassonvillei subsp. dassonvillei DSM 43111]NKY79002.1 ABC transporter ATP-binding protein [Nocardiopsis dassonvillei]VEI92003.1 Glutathione import ATP-binding protein GsiA [Nocardiopsis dassonvillei]
MSTDTVATTEAASAAPLGDTPVLEVTDLTVTFGGLNGNPDVRAVRGVSYSVRRGEVLGIVGESGSGKSVSSMAAMGLLPDHARITGSVRLHGEEILGLDDRAMARKRGKVISMVFQDPLSGLTPVYTVGDQLAEAVLVHDPSTPKARARARAVELLELVGIPNAEQRYRSFPHEFSGGMRQRVMIAMAMANDPDVIICDEPTTALDVTIQAQILDLLRTAREETGAAIVMITHDLGVVAGFVDRVLVMYAGRPVETGRVDDIYYRSRMPYTMGLLGAVPRMDLEHQGALVPIKGTPPSLSDLPPGCPFAPRCPLARPECDAAEPELLTIGAQPSGGRIRAGGAAARPDAGEADAQRVACVRSGEITDRGWTAQDIYPVPEIPDSPASAVDRADRAEMLRVRDLVKHHPLTKGAVFKRRVGSVYAVDGIDFDIREGETLALVGESGCGKSSTLMEIMDLARPQRGSISVMGRDVATLGRADRFALRRDMQIVFQDPMSSLDPRMTVFDIIAEPLRTHGRSVDEVTRRVYELIDLVGLNTEHVTRFPAEFSGGQRQRIGIARALALEPRLLVLDEPVSALDVSIQAGVVNLLQELQARLGLSYLFVAHDLSVVRHIADRVAVMYLGRIVEIGDTRSVYSRPSHPYTQALLSAIPIPDPEKERARTHIVLDGDLPSPANPPSGCRFRTRCQKFALLPEADREQCRTVEPQVLAVNDGDQAAACHFAER